MHRRLSGRLPRGGMLVLPFGAVLAVVAFTSGVGLGALTISTGAESGAGNAEVASSVTWWHLLTVATDTIPGAALNPLSGNMTVPTTLLSSNTSYALGPVTSGHGAIRLDFQEKNGPPPAKEFEFSVTVVNATGASRSSTVFLQTQFPLPTGPLTFSFFIDTGTGSASLQSVSELAQTCPAQTMCP